MKSFYNPFSDILSIELIQLSIEFELKLLTFGVPNSQNDFVCVVIKQKEIKDHIKFWMGWIKGGWVVLLKTFSFL